MRRGCSAPCRGGGCLAAPREPWLWLPAWFLKVSSYHLSPWCPSQFHLLVLLLPHLRTTLRLVVRSYTALEWFSLKWQGPPEGTSRASLSVHILPSWQHSAMEYSLLAALFLWLLFSCLTSQPSSSLPGPTQTLVVRLSSGLDSPFSSLLTPYTSRKVNSPISPAKNFLLSPIPERSFDQCLLSA